MEPECTCPSEQKRVSLFFWEKQSDRKSFPFPVLSPLVGWFGDNRFCPVLLVPVWHLYSHVKMFAYTCSNMYPIPVSPGTSSSIQGIRTHVSAFSYIFLCSFVRSASLCHTECISSHSSYLCFIKSKAYYFLEIVSLFPSRFLSPTRTMCICGCVLMESGNNWDTSVAFYRPSFSLFRYQQQQQQQPSFLVRWLEAPSGGEIHINSEPGGFILRHVTAHMWRHNLAMQPSILPPTNERKYPTQGSPPLWTDTDCQWIVNLDPL